MISKDDLTGIDPQNDELKLDSRENTFDDKIINIKEDFTHYNETASENHNIVANRIKIIVDSSEYDSLEELDAKIMDYIGKDDDMVNGNA